MSSSIGLLGVEVVGCDCVCGSCGDTIVCCDFIMTGLHNSVKVEGLICTMSPLVVVEGPLLEVEELMSRTACRPPPALFEFLNLFEHSLPSAACSLPPHDWPAVPDKNSFGKWFSENVCHLLIHGRSVHDDFLSFDMLKEMVKRFVDVFSVRAHFG